MTVCFYHSADFDGKCSAAIVKMAHPDCELVGIDHGQEFPLDKCDGNDVIMVDFSPKPIGVLKDIEGRAKTFLWIDHHKSAIEEAGRIGFDMSNHVLDNGFAACELTWKKMSDDAPMPEAVRLLGRYDIWKQSEAPFSNEFQYGLRMEKRAVPEDVAFWKELFGMHRRNPDDGEESLVERIVEDGKVAWKYEQVQNAEYARRFAFETEFEGLKCIALNRGIGNSILFDSVFDRKKHDAMICFAWNRTFWTVSIYAVDPAVDASAIAKKHGGGGHKGAAGFQASKLPFPPFSQSSTTDVGTSGTVK